MAVRDLMASYVAPFFWVTQINEERLVENSSCFFLDCGEGPFLVTANHVYEGYLSRKKEHPRTRCQIFNLIFEPELRLIDSDATVDIATFDITLKEINEVGNVDRETRYPKIPLQGDQSQWPPAPPEVEKGIWFSGFPGCERLRTGLFELNFGIFTALAIATSINERRVSCHLDKEYAVETPEFPLPPQGYDMGGLSGSPLVTVVDRSGLLMTWRLGGIIIEASSDFEILTASRADFILPDGRLRKPL